MKLPRQCAILVGGLGTRMGQLTAETPKPLLDCGGRPFLAWILRELARFGIEEVVLLAGYKSERIDVFCQEAQAYLPRALSIKVSVEPSPAGTGGAVWHARQLLDDAFLLINGDSWIDTNLAKFLAASVDAPDAIGCVLLRAMEDCTRYGTVELRGCHIVTFREKASISAPGLINSGIYAFDKGVLEFLSPKCSLEIEVLPLLAEKGLLAGQVLDGYFIDIGIPTDYARAGDELPRRLMRPAVFFDWDGVLSPNPGWAGGKDKLSWIAGAKDAFRLVNEAGFHAFVVANQTGAEHGLPARPDVESFHNYIQQDLLRDGGTIDDIRSYPCPQTAAADKSRRNSNWPKPTPGIFLDFLARWGVDYRRSIFIGNRETDLKAAKAAGIEGYRYSSGSFHEFIKPLVARLRAEG